MNPLCKVDHIKCAVLRVDHADLVLLVGVDIVLLEDRGKIEVAVPRLVGSVDVVDTHGIEVQ